MNARAFIAGVLFGAITIALLIGVAERLMF